MEQPDSYYHHPSPFMTNVYWSEEIQIGPGPPPRRSGKKSRDDALRTVNTAGTQSSVGSNTGSSLDFNGFGPTDAMDPTHMLAMEADGFSDANWNRRRYQREDEELWGLRSLASRSHVVPRRVLGRSATGHDGAGTAAGSRSASESYYFSRNPPVNDLHPPVVSKPSPNPQHTRWMLQPPPSAKVMSGKVRAFDRSRSDSAASNPGGRKVSQTSTAGQKDLERKAKGSDGQPSRTSSRISSRSIADVEKPKNVSQSTTDMVPSRSMSWSKRHHLPVKLWEDSSSESVDLDQPGDVALSQRAGQSEDIDSRQKSQKRPQLSHQRLSTIMSSRAYSSSSGEVAPSLNDSSGPRKPPPIFIADRSLVLMQKRGPTNDPGDATREAAPNLWIGSSQDTSPGIEMSHAGLTTLMHRDPRMRWSMDF